MKVVRTEETAWSDGMQRGAFFQRRKKLLGDVIASSVWELPAGKKSFPFHRHSATEEALFVLSGSAKVRSDKGLTDIGKGDFVSFTAGEDAHQLINDGAEPLVYLAMSVSKGLDVTEYPDSNKVHIVAGSGPSSKSYVFRQTDTVGYFDGEPDAG